MMRACFLSTHSDSCSVTICLRPCLSVSALKNIVEKEFLKKGYLLTYCFSHVCLRLKPIKFRPTLPTSVIIRSIRN